ncbi:MAG: tetratricopeptide repeat protein [Dehalococcoidia bacterium]
MENTTSQTLPLDVENAINAVASSINAGEAIIFCGAGISRDSGFPVVEDIVPYVLLTLCADSKEIPTIEASLKAIPDAAQRQGRLKQIIAEKMAVSPEVVGKIIHNLPFEAFIETLHDNSKIDEILEIYNADAYQPHVEPNANHMMLARLVAAGKVRTIVTTNFDQLIEKALEKQGKQAGVDYDVIYREEDFKHIGWTQDRCRLIKIHGSIDDKKAMDITLRQVAKKELSEARERIISHVFSQGKHKTVLIMGYSCSDVFDLSPQIQVLAENLKQVFFVQHLPKPSDKPNIQDIREAKDKNPFKAVGNSTRLFFNTSALVEALWKATLKEPFDNHMAPKTTPDWNAKVQSWYVDSVQTYSECVGDVISGRIFGAISEWRAAMGRYQCVLAYAKEHANDRLEGFALGKLGSVYMKLGESRKAIGLFEQALEIARRIGDVGGEGASLGGMGSAYDSLGEYRKAIELYEQSLEIKRRIGDAQGEGTSLGNMGGAYFHLGEYHKAINLYEECLEIARSTGDVQGEGAALENMGSACNCLGEYLKAIKLYEQSLKIEGHIGNVQGRGTSLGNMGNAYSNLGDCHKAIGLYERHLEIARRIGDVPGEGTSLGNLGNAYSSLGEYRKAIELYEQSLEIKRRIGDAQGEGTSLRNMGNTCNSLGEYRKAIGLLEQALEIARRIGDIRGEGTSLANLGIVYLDLRNYSKAIGLFEQALEMARRTGNIRAEGRYLGIIGSAHLYLEDYSKAIEFFEQALEIARRTGDTQGEGAALRSIGSAYALMGEKEKAAQAFSQSKAVFTKIEMPHMVSQLDGLMKQIGL